MSLDIAGQVYQEGWNGFHQSFHRDGKTDVGAMRLQALYRIKERGIPTIIHHHAKEDHPEPPECFTSSKHELFHPDNEEAVIING